MVDGDDSFKRPGAVPFKWEIRPGVPKNRPGDDDDAPPTLPPNKLAPLKLKPSPSSSSSSSSSFFISESKSRPVSPFAPPSSFKLKPAPDSDSHSSGPPTPYFRSSSARAGAVLPRCFRKSFFGLKKSKSGDVKKTDQEPSSSSSESDNFYESGTTFSPSEYSSQGSVSSRWGSPKSSLSSHRGSPLKRTDSDLSSYEKKFEKLASNCKEIKPRKLAISISEKKG